MFGGFGSFQFALVAEKFEKNVQNEVTKFRDLANLCS